MTKKLAKVESIKEFLARGGRIEKVVKEKPPEESLIVRPTIAGPPELYSLDEAQHFFGVKKKKKVKKDSKPDFSDIDRSIIPGSLQHIFEENK